MRFKHIDTYCVKWQIETKVVKKEHLLKKYFKFPACGG